MSAIVKFDLSFQRLEKCVNKIIYYERQLYSLPDSTLDSPFKTILNCIGKWQSKLLQASNQFKKELNLKGRAFKLFNPKEKKLFDYVISELTVTSLEKSAYYTLIAMKKLQNDVFTGKREQSVLFLETLQMLAKSFMTPACSDEITNLVPSAFSGKIRKFSRLSPAEEVLPLHLQMIKDRILAYFKERDYNLLNPIEKEILLFLEGKISTENVSMNQKNGRVYLTVIKVIDLAIAEYNRTNNEFIAFSRWGYELRTAILKICSPDMTTAEAYTKTPDPKKWKNKIFLCNPNHWIPERIGFYSKILTNQMIISGAFSLRVNHFIPSLLVVRGNTAAGKTKAMSRDPLFQTQLEKEGGMQKILNPDHFKHRLKKKHIADLNTFILNHQVHEEGSAFFKFFLNGLKKDALNLSFLIEGRYSSLEEIECNILELAKKKKGEVFILDIETPLISSLNRVLIRDPLNDQCPMTLDIVKGYKASVNYRNKLIEIVKGSSLVACYKLNVYDSQGKQHQICLEELERVKASGLNDQEILEQVEQIIDSVYIDEAIKRGDFPEEKRWMLEQWKGVMISKAVDLHASGLSAEEGIKQIREESKIDEMYGSVKILPFEVTWLADIPYLIDHVLSEQFLHIRGVDEEGKGLHWQTNKFAWKLNPLFNPENKKESGVRGGFQMKIGYFVIPPSKTDLFASSLLSPKIQSELEVKTASGEIEGYRLFVHPEAYSHFSSLHQSQDIRFVKPMESEYLGTPTSSYRSWVIRRVSKHENHWISQPEAMPFIVKMGVAGFSQDTSKLLPRSEVEKSLRFQFVFEKMENSVFSKGGNGADFFIFPETFGLCLKNVPHYPPQNGGEVNLDSGMIVREFPGEFLEGRCKILSFSALMSVERIKEENKGICSLSEEKLMEKMPLIYEVIHSTIKKGIVHSSEEFIFKYFIKGYLKAIEQVYFQSGLPLSVHGQNLCFVLNPDNTPRGFAYRDFEGISAEKEKGFMESFSWFYRYHVFIKLLNVITDKTQISSALGSTLQGAPSQIGLHKHAEERNVHAYMAENIAKLQASHQQLKLIAQLSLHPQQQHRLLLDLDREYFALLSQYFDWEKAEIAKVQNGVPVLYAAESGSDDEALLLELNAQLWQHRYSDTPRVKKNPCLLKEGSFEMPFDLINKKDFFLKDVDLRKWDLTQFYSQCVNLESVAFSHCIFDREVLNSFLHSVNKLKSIKFYACSVPEYFLLAEAKCASNLVKIEISAGSASNSLNLAFLRSKKFTSLKTLVLDRHSNQLFQKDSLQKKYLPSLETLQVYYTSADVEKMKADLPNVIIYHK